MLANLGSAREHEKEKSQSYVSPWVDKINKSIAIYILITEAASFFAPPLFFPFFFWSGIVIELSPSKTEPD